MIGKMTCTSYYEAECHKCGATTRSDPEHDVEQWLKALKARGWTEEDLMDLCPACAASRERGSAATAAGGSPAAEGVGE